MSDRKLAVLGIVAVVMAGWAILQSRMNRQADVDFGSTVLIEGLDIEAVSAIQIAGADGEDPTTLSRNGATFVVSNKDNYPADITKINTLISQCLDIRTYDMITDNPENHAELKVTPETARCVVSFLDKDSQAIVALAMSDSDEDGKAFVRLLSGNAVFSIESAPMINTTPINYIDAKLFQIEKSKVASVTVKTGDDVYTLSSPEGSDEIQLDPMPAGKQFKGKAYQSVFTGLGSVPFRDVQAVDSVSDDLRFDSEYTCQLYDKTVYKLALAQQGQMLYAKVSADYLDKTPVEKERRVETEEELKEKEAKLLAIDNVKSFNQDHQGWVYEFPSYMSGNLTQPLSELLEEIPEPETPDETADNAETAPGSEAANGE